MDKDLNKYDLEHCVTAHARMSKEEWEGVYRDAWKRYYTDEHVQRVINRAVATGLKPRKVADVLTAFSGGTRIEGVHPLQLGIVRRKLRTQRRSGMKLENPLIFYPRRFFEWWHAVGQWAILRARYQRMITRAKKEQAVRPYLDKALTPSQAEDAAGTSDFIHVFADKIPHTYGAPGQHAPAAESVTTVP